MPHDFTAQDAELDALGTVPADLKRLAFEFAGEVPQELAAVDALLDALGVSPEGLAASRKASPQPSVASRSAASHTRAAEERETGHVVEPVAERHDPQSGEIALGAQKGGDDASQSASAQRSAPPPVAGDVSGSFQLPGAVPDDGAADDPSAAMQDALSSQVPGASSREGRASEAPPTEGEFASAARREDSLTAAMVSDFEPPEVTQIVPTESRAPAASADVEFAIDEPAVRKDPADDEFDALFEGLTSASDAPPQPEDGETGLVTQSRPISRVREEQQRVQPYVPDGTAEDFDDGEETKAFSAADLHAAHDSTDASLSDSLVEDIDLEELDSGELELVLDEDSSSLDEPGDDDSPDDGGDNKPGGLLGRFLGRKK